MRTSFLLPALLLTLSHSGAWAEPPARARGVVFDDRNGNGTRDDGEPGLPDVLVSNQREVTATGADGSWSLPVRDDCIFFVIKPRGWMPPVNEHQLPRFFHIHKPAGSPGSEYPGVAPTGPLPASIDFALKRQDEPDTFKAHFFGDTQARNKKELGYMARDTIQELIGTDASFGVTLGDILFDDLSLFDTHNGIVSMIGVPWWNVIGNHDLNFDSPDDRHSDETFERVYGPSYYAFSYGPVNFITLDNVRWGGARQKGGTGKYTAELGEDQLAFLENLVPRLPEDQLLLLMMHIPFRQSAGPQPPHPDTARLFRLIEKRPYTMSIAGHTHWHAHMFLGKEDGWHGEQPHHHVVNVTVCGSWWRGEPDELGIPNAMGRDGAPRGYSTITFDGTQAVVDFKAARRPAGYQMRISAPEVVRVGDAATVHVNVFNGSEKSRVRLRIGERGEWITLGKVVEADPDYLALKKREESREDKLEGAGLPGAVPSHHLWKTNLPPGLPSGTHRLWVQSEDMYGRLFNASRVIRVE